MAFGFTMRISKAAYQKALAKSRRKSGSNRDRSVVEFYRFQHRKKHGPWGGYLKGHKITNWTGLRLCDVTMRTTSRQGYRDVSGRRPERVNFWARCVDGRLYVGTSPGDGMYARLRPAKGPSRRSFS